VEIVTRRPGTDFQCIFGLLTYGVENTGIGTTSVSAFFGNCEMLGTGLKMLYFRGFLLWLIPMPENSSRC